MYMYIVIYIYIYIQLYMYIYIYLYIDIYINVNYKCVCHKTKALTKLLKITNKLVSNMKKVDKTIHFGSAKELLEVIQPIVTCLQGKLG